MVMIGSLVGGFSLAEDAPPPLLRPGDRVALLGGSFFERMQSTGELEAEIQCRRADWKLTFRNLGWSGDDASGIARKRFDAPENGFERLLQDVETADPTVVLIAYGFAEASDGAAAVERFQPALTRLVEAIAGPGRRVILLSPLAMPGYQVDRYAEWIEQCRQIVSQVAKASDLPVISLDWQPSDTELDRQRLFPNHHGYFNIAQMIADPLVGGQPCDHQSLELRTKIAEKNELFFHRYRPQNETYLFLFRKHEQGNNAAEIPQFDPLINAADQAIWELAKGTNQNPQN